LQKGNFRTLCRIIGSWKYDSYTVAMNNGSHRQESDHQQSAICFTRFRHHTDAE
jgi:hypothetical protein